MNNNKFQQTVRNFYEEQGRDLPWRNTDNQYAIFVSEIMLQQTQVPRVIPEYQDWIQQWPNFKALAKTDRSGVLKAWQGLGFNRRAKFLHQSAQKVMDEYNSRLPESRAELKKLPGVGSYTSGALMAFCFNEPLLFIETNIRAVYLHHYFPEKEEVSDTEIKTKLGETMPENDVREWYYALMDYGQFIKKTEGNPNTRSKTYNTQSQFAGSNRQLRSQLLRFVLNNEPVSLEQINDNLQPETDRQKSIKENLANLEKEEMIIQTADGLYRVPQ